MSAVKWLTVRYPNGTGDQVTSLAEARETMRYWVAGEETWRIYRDGGGRDAAEVPLALIRRTPRGSVYSTRDTTDRDASQRRY